MSDRTARLIITGFILGMFAFVLLKHPDNALLIGALIAMATTAKDFWLGASQGDKKPREPTGTPSDPVSTHEVERP